MQNFILFLFFLYSNNHYGNTSNIISEPLEYASKKTILPKKYPRGPKPLAYTPEVTPMGLFVTYPSFLPDLYETWIFSTDFRKMFEYHATRHKNHSDSRSQLNTVPYDSHTTHHTLPQHQINITK